MTGHVRRLDLAKWRLKVTGKVANPLIMTYDELRCLPRIEERVDLGCPGFFLDTATWAGARMADVLALARPDAAATQLEMVSADGYVTELPLKDALVSENLVAYEWEGKPLPILHGFPARAIIPNYDGSTWAKWLVEIRVK